MTLLSLFFEHLRRRGVALVSVLPASGEGESADRQEKGGSSFIGSKLEPPSGQPDGGLLLREY